MRRGSGALSAWPDPSPFGQISHLISAAKTHRATAAPTAMSHRPTVSCLARHRATQAAEALRPRRLGVSRSNSPSASASRAVFASLSRRTIMSMYDAPPRPESPASSGGWRSPASRHKVWSARKLQDALRAHGHGAACLPATPPTPCARDAERASKCRSKPTQNGLKRIENAPKRAKTGQNSPKTVVR